MKRVRKNYRTYFFGQLRIVTTDLKRAEKTIKKVYKTMNVFENLITPHTEDY